MPTVKEKKARVGKSPKKTKAHKLVRAGFERLSDLGLLEASARPLPKSRVRRSLSEGLFEPGLLSVVLNISGTQLLRRLAGQGALIPAEGERVVLAEQLMARGTSAFGDRDVFMAWLKDENVLLGKRPIDLIRTATGMAVVMDELTSIEHGIPRMKLYRLSGADYAGTLDGMGAALKRGGARWNATGVPMIYCAEHRSLAFTEVLAHFKEISRFPRNYVFITYNVTGTKGIRRPDPATLPPDWNADGPPYLRGAQGYGSAFIASKDLLLRVPSVVIPHEWNYLMIPNAVAGRVTIESIEPFVVDARYDVFIPRP